MLSTKVFILKVKSKTDTCFTTIGYYRSFRNVIRSNACLKGVEFVDVDGTLAYTSAKGTLVLISEEAVL